MLEKEKEEFGEMKHIQFVGNDDKSIVIINVSNYIFCNVKKLLACKQPWFTYGSV